MLFLNNWHTQLSLHINVLRYTKARFLAVESSPLTNLSMKRREGKTVHVQMLQNQKPGRFWEDFLPP